MSATTDRSTPPTCGPHDGPAPAAARAVARAAAAAAAPRGGDEYPFSDADFDAVRTLIHRRAGIALSSGKQAMVYSRLTRRLRETGHRSFRDYLEDLRQARDDHPEWQAFVNALTTNLTSFFREAHHFAMLGEALRERAGRATRIWCTAASTGEEPYSLAMTVEESVPGANVSILATDIDTDVLAKARRAVYAADAGGLDAARLKRHFLRGSGTNDGLIRVRPALAARVSFDAFNLIAPQWPAQPPHDFVFCRNVMIYFDEPTQHQVMRRLHASMPPGGLLFVGHSEHFAELRSLFVSLGQTVYRRV